LTHAPSGHAEVVEQNAASPLAVADRGRVRDGDASASKGMGDSLPGDPEARP